MTERGLPRFPGYDVLAKRHTQSWNEPTRHAIDKRMSVAREPRFLTKLQFATLEALADIIVPQDAAERAPIPVASLVDARLLSNAADGFRPAGLPPLREAWTRGLDALEAEAQARHGTGFASLDAERRTILVHEMSDGVLRAPEWGDMTASGFFSNRALSDIVSAYYSHPASWNEIGFGGPASPRGYVRLDAEKHDPWEAAEAKPGRDEEAMKENRRVV